jgi:small subunit ribosomal protein S20
MRSSVRKRDHNRSVKSRLGTLETKYINLLGKGQRDEAVSALRSLSSALDKAAKVGIVHRATASRKKSRMASRLNSASAAPAAAPAAETEAAPAE